MDRKDIAAIEVENRRRNEALHCRYDQLAGVGCCGKRAYVGRGKCFGGRPMVPVEMKADSEYASVGSAAEFDRLRCRYDFEFWAVRCVRIKDKRSGRDIPFMLNAPQRRVLSMMEEDRRAGRPIRIIMLKARQWGGSTLVQMYMAWIQLTQRINWNSLICAHVKDTSATIRGMYTKMLDNYPEEMCEDGCRPTFKPFEVSRNIRVISGRGCRVTLGSSENSDGIRGGDYAMAHLSEVAFWKSTPQEGPDDLIRAVCGGINSDPLTLVVLESTANGIGNYFHSEWLRSKCGDSDKRAIFVPWYEIEIYRREVTDVAALVASMDDYECGLWDMGLTLEMICWYHFKRREYGSHKQMQAEYPTTDVEAFANSENNVFPVEQVERLRDDCCEPRRVGDLVGENYSTVGVSSLRGVRFADDVQGLMKVWEEPDAGNQIPRRYVVAVDVGGRSPLSDWSVIAVLDRGYPRPRIVAQWRGHVDHDMLAWKGAMIARWYCDALLVFESNTLETEAIEGDPAQYILNEVRNHYPNLYHRRNDEGGTRRIGFHTNRATKSMIINRLIAVVRDGGYVERDREAVNELLTYQTTPNGGFAARPGCHDDILMTRAILLHVAMRMPEARLDESWAAYRRRFEFRPTKRV